MVSIHKILLHNNELFHPIVIVVSGIAQNWWNNLYNDGFNEICGFAGFFQKCINDLLSKESLHIMLVTLISFKYSAHFLSCCSFMCFMILSVLNNVKSLLVDQIPCFLDDEPSNAATPNGVTTSSVTASWPSDVQKLQDAVVTLLWEYWVEITPSCHS